MPDRRCSVCRTDDQELRPYGPRGAWICFDCMTTDSALEAGARRAFAMQLDACGPVGVIGEETGPRPLEKGNA